MYEPRELAAAVIALVLPSNSLRANLLDPIATAQRLASVHPVAAALLVIPFFRRLNHSRRL